ncbi:MAG: hypothetical protein KDC83_00895 [Flavobacteriales bacterium]|nr:hypothetical protein [Flavobacteriales bacterium]
MLTHEEYSTLARLRNQMVHNPQTFTREDIRQYLELFQRDGEKGYQEVQKAMRRTNTNNINDLAERLANRNNNNLLEGLLYAGLGILIGWALIESLDSKKKK